MENKVTMREGIIRVLEQEADFKVLPVEDRPKSAPAIKTKKKYSDYKTDTASTLVRVTRANVKRESSFLEETLDQEE